MAGRGEIVKRTLSNGDVRYLARVWSGKRKSVSKTFRTKRDANAWRAEMLTEVNARGLIVPSKLPLGAWLRSWLSTYKASKLKSHVLDHYTRTLGRYVIEPEHHRVPDEVKALALGSRALGTLRAEDFQKLYNAMGTERARTKRYLDTLLRQAMKRAVASRLIAESPLLSVERPAAGENKRERRVLTAEQMTMFLAAIETHKHRTLWTLELMHGLRPGEVLALRWQDVDLDKRTLKVNATLTPDRKRGTPKTKNATREITLTPNSVPALAAHKLKSGGRSQDPDALIFTTETGTPEHLNNVSRRFQTLKRKLGPAVIPTDMTMYELRHSYVSVMLDNKASIAALSKQLGHANVKITLQAYAWAMPDASSSLADQFDSVLDVARNKANNL